MTSLTTFEDLEIPALTEVAKESFQEALWATERALTKQLEFGRIMLIVKSKLPYGEWGNWVRQTFDDHLSLRTIQTHMKAHQAVAQNPALLECANSLDDILTLTSKPRKPSVEVVEPIEVVASMPPILNDPRKPQPVPERTEGETATNAVSREETRKAPAHRPPEKFAEVTPSYEDEDENVEEPEASEPAFNELLATDRLCTSLRRFIRDELSRWPTDKRDDVLSWIDEISKEFRRA